MCIMTLMVWKERWFGNGGAEIIQTLLEIGQLLMEIGIVRNRPRIIGNRSGIDRNRSIVRNMLIEMGPEVF